MKVLVANRGEIACRIFRALREMGVPGVAVVSEADGDAMHPDLADESVSIGPPKAYLDGAKLIEAARRSGADAVHPGYGFLSQSAAFARACRKAGLVFIGPSPEAMELMADKRSSRRTAERASVPVVPGAVEVDTLEALEAAADTLGYPLLLKAAGGGGGRGMRQVGASRGLKEAFEAARREARGAFGDDRLLVEKYLRPARHVEVQILADGREAVALGERECSLQRRYQKVIEEAPAALVAEKTCRALEEAAVRLARAAGYRSAGTVEFLVEPGGAHYFLEMNTRLQVEHPVTEQVTGIDIVRAQIELELGRGLPTPVPPRGHAIEARLNAEDPYREWMPQTGRVLMLEWPQRPGLRIDAGIREGQTIGSHFDPLLAKVIAWGGTREESRRRLIEGLRETVLLGVVTNQAWLLQILESDFFVRGLTYTTTLEEQHWTEPAVPAEVEAIARKELEAPRGGGEGGGTGDRYSPWGAP